MRGIKIVPALLFNLFSITKRQLDGWSLGSNRTAIWIEKGLVRLTFDIRIETSKGVLFAVCIWCNTIDMLWVSQSTRPRLSYNRVHAMLGHMGEEATCSIAWALQWDIISGFTVPCISCMAAKA